MHGLVSCSHWSFNYRILLQVLLSAPRFCLASSAATEPPSTVNYVHVNKCCFSEKNTSKWHMGDFYLTWCCSFGNEQNLKCHLGVIVCAPVLPFDMEASIPSIIAMLTVNSLRTQSLSLYHNTLKIEIRIEIAKMAMSVEYFSALFCLFLQPFKPRRIDSIFSFYTYLHFFYTYLHSFHTCIKCMYKIFTHFTHIFIHFIHIFIYFIVIFIHFIHVTGGISLSPSQEILVLSQTSLTFIPDTLWLKPSHHLPAESCVLMALFVSA